MEFKEIEKYHSLKYISEVIRKPIKNFHYLFNKRKDRGKQTTGGATKSQLEICDALGYGIELITWKLLDNKTSLESLQIEVERLIELENK